jgi:hypothetical protein
MWRGGVSAQDAQRALTILRFDFRGARAQKARE